MPDFSLQTKNHQKDEHSFERFLLFSFIQKRFSQSKKKGFLEGHIPPFEMLSDSISQLSLLINMVITKL